MNLGSVAILGLAISFGSQNLVRDVVNGFFILLENQYAVGDVVSINGKTGGVEKITIRSTWVRSATGDLHCIPNGSISLVSNLTRGWSRAICEIGVSYDADLKLEAFTVVTCGCGAASAACPFREAVRSTVPAPVQASTARSGLVSACQD